MWLFDTNILSELRGPRPDQSVTAFVTACKVKELYVSSVTLAELRYGIDILTDPIRRDGFNKWIAGEVRPMFAGRIVEVTEDILLRWRRLVEDGRKAGRTYSQPDLLIAATALEHDLTLVTRNVKDFVSIHMKLFNPWSSQSS